ncbi:uncharacterized protein [Magallana gigas]|uniref:uncharacterized protein isoform X6 n=1 Tax=Magallana gigas TaxID=29159 RepID=UPI003341CDB3
MSDKTSYINWNHSTLRPAQTNNTFASWNANLGQPYTIKFHLTITQTRTNETLRQTLTRNVRDIVKPAPVSKIFAESISSTSLKLKWENSHPDRFQIYGIFSSDEWTSHNFSKNLSKTKDRIQEMNFTDLIPFTKYYFTITRRPLRKTGANSYVQNGHWSRPTSATIRTLPDEPVSPPIIIEGSFSRVGEHQVVLYWKPIKPMDRRGIISNYTVDFASLNDNMKSSIVSQYENISLPLDSNKWYNISIFAVTLEGFKSPSNSEIVPSKIDGPQISSVVIELNRNRTEALVHWEPNSECLYYVVFWKTDTKLDWKTSIQSNTTLSVQNLSNFKVGVSCSANLFHSSLANLSHSSPANLSHSSPANLSHSSLEESMVVGGGMWWSNCKYPEETEPALASSLTLTPDQAALDVTWTLLCDGLSSYPQWFNLTWCDLHPSKEVCQDEDYVLLDPREKYYRLEDLNHSRTYRVRINSVSKDNHVRTNMEYKDKKPGIYEYIEDKATYLILPLTIILSIIIVVVILLIYIVRKCKSEKDAMAVEVPFVPFVQNKDAKEDVSYNTRNKQFLELKDKMDYQVVDGSQYSDLEKDSSETRINDIELGLKDQEVEPEVPFILDEMMMVDKVKKSKKTPQSSDYSKFIVASGHTNNSDVFHQSQSQSGNHVHESQSPLSSDDVSPSVLTNQNLSTDLSQSDPLSNQTWSGMQNKKVTSSSSSSSSSSDDDDNEDDAYQDVGHFDDSSSSTDTSAYPPLQSVPYSRSGYTEQDIDSYSKARVNEDISAGTDDELLISSQDPESSGCGKDSTEFDLKSPQSIIHSAKTQQVLSEAALTSFPASNTPVLQSCANSPSPPPLGDLADSSSPTEDSVGQPSSTSGASVTSSTSDYNEGGYKAVELDSGWTSSIQSSAYH